MNVLAELLPVVLGALSGLAIAGSVVLLAVGILWLLEALRK